MRRLLAIPVAIVSLACCQHEPTPADEYEQALNIWTMEYEHNRTIKATYSPEEPEYQQSYERLVVAANNLRAKRKAFYP